MNAKEQKKYMDAALVKVKGDGRTIGWFLKSVQISRSHWHFMRKCKRPLLPSSVERINDILKTLPHVKDNS